MQTLTRKEEQIMQAVWQIGHPCLISEILKKDVTLKRNTVAPGIITLTKKGYLKVDSIGKSMTRTGRAYAPLISNPECEVAHFPEQGLYCVINNTDQPQKTTVTLADGTTEDFDLPDSGIAWREA